MSYPISQPQQNNYKKGEFGKTAYMCTQYMLF